MAQSLNSYLGVTHINPVGMGELEADSSSAEHNPGTMSMMMSLFGPVMYKYTKDQQSGGMTQGQLARKVDTVTGTITVISGEVNDTLHAADTTNFTAVGDEEGKIFNVTDNNDSAGGTPEAESAVIIKSTLTQLTFDSRFPLSTAIAENDTYANFSIFNSEDAVDGDFCYEVLGVMMADRTAGNYGWVQFYGNNPHALNIGGAITALAPIVAAAASVGTHGSDTQELWLGYQPNTITADLVVFTSTLIYLDLLTTVHAIAHA